MQVTITSDLRVISEEYGDITEGVVQEMAALRMEEFDREAEQAEARQVALWKSTQGEARVAEFGALKAQIDPFVFAHWEQRYGHGFFGEKGNLEWFLKKCPSARVKARSDRLTVQGVSMPGRTGVRGRHGRWAL